MGMGWWWCCLKWMKDLLDKLKRRVSFFFLLNKRKSRYPLIWSNGLDCWHTPLYLTIYVFLSYCNQVTQLSCFADTHPHSHLCYLVVWWDTSLISLVLLIQVMTLFANYYSYFSIYTRFESYKGIFSQKIVTTFWYILLLLLYYIKR